MGEQRNLTEDNVEELREKLMEMQKENPELEYRFFEQTEESEPQDEQLTIKTLFGKLVEIEQKINHIFDGHVLINGEFKKISH